MDAENMTFQQRDCIDSPRTIRGHSFVIVEHPVVGFARLLTSDPWAALASLASDLRLDVSKSVRHYFVRLTMTDGTEVADWSEVTPELAMRHLLATELTSWDDFPGWEDY